MRLILSSFALLGLVFYELSGGADFQPPEPPTLAAQKQQLSTDPAPAVQPMDQLALVTSDASTAVSMVAAPAITTETPNSAVSAVAFDTTKSDSERNLGEVRSSLSQGLTLLPGSNPAQSLTLVSLELGASGLQALQTASAGNSSAEQLGEIVATFETTPKDIREVTGTRVNMRDGPGTIYPIVARLSFGQKAEVLGESGTGWLRMRTLPEQQLGWISSSLISKPDR